MKESCPQTASLIKLTLNAKHQPAPGSRDKKLVAQARREELGRTHRIMVWSALRRRTQCAWSEHARLRTQPQQDHLNGGADGRRRGCGARGRGCWGMRGERVRTAVEGRRPGRRLAAAAHNACAAAHRTRFPSRMVSCTASIERQRETGHADTSGWDRQSRHRDAIRQRVLHRLTRQPLSGPEPCQTTRQKPLDPSSCSATARSGSALGPIARAGSTVL
jgi:hypothetical protein